MTIVVKWCDDETDTYTDVSSIYHDDNQLHLVMRETMDCSLDASQVKTIEIGGLN